jgi:hypothetical protein
MSPWGLTVSCKSPPHIRACIDSGSPFGHALTQVPHSGMHLLRFPIWAYIDWGPCIWASIDSGGEQAHFVSFKNDSRHCVIKWRQRFEILTDLKCASSRAFIWGITWYSSYNFKIWPLVSQFSTLVLTMKVMDDRSSKLFSWEANHALLSHQVWSWSIQKYSKNKVFVSFTTWPNFDLDPYNLAWLLLTPRHLYMLTIMIHRCKTKKV